MWKACLNSHSLVEYAKESNTEKGLDTDDAYSANAQYYCSGIYEIGESETRTTTSNATVCVDSFDWRVRHGHDWWITIPKNQGASGYCTAFATVGALEAMANLYYNRNLNYDLSEQDVAYYGHVNYFYGGSIYNAVNYVVNNGVIDELSLPFQDTSSPQMPQNRPFGNEKVGCTSYSSIFLTSTNEEQVKQFLISHGPCASGFNTASGSQSHAMTLTGYGKVTANDMYTYVYQWSVDTVLVNGDPRIGKTFWKFKNSYYEDGHDIWDHGHDGYMYIIFNTPERMHGVYSLNIPIDSRSLSNDSIVVEDSDGDGYFNWGIGSKPSHCPAWAPNDSDGDDSDRTKGPMDAYGYCSQLSTGDPQHQYIRNDTTLTVSKTWTMYLGVIRGAMVTIKAPQFFSNGTKLLLDNGTTMVLDGTTIVGSYIQPYAGSTIILNNGARITKPFEVPLGVKLIINNGGIY